MKYLDELLGKQESLAWRGDLHVPVSGIEYDSRKIKKNDCFVSIKGLLKDGFDYAADAIRKGASAVVSIHPPPPNHAQATWVQVKNDRRVLSQLASRFFDNPSQKLQVIGVTGTNGKTTTVGLIQTLLNATAKTAAIGTLSMNFPGHVQKTKLTTPEAPELFAFMAEARQGRMPEPGDGSIVGRPQPAPGRGHRVCAGGVHVVFRRSPRFSSYHGELF